MFVMKEKDLSYPTAFSLVGSVICALIFVVMTLGG